MPTYEYKCDACGHRFDQSQSIKADPLKKCPSCGKLKLKRLISAGGGIIFKGSGFYITDYRDAAYKDSAKADDKAKSDSAGGESKSDGKSEGKDSKPAEKPAGKPSEGSTPEAKPATPVSPAPTPTPPSDKRDRKSKPSENK